ncbi:MAG: hypothetical protein EA356_12785 [Geminicoccaceae bacterium]|nr:MAG: hypothetical protein EA356_12785 [Geminicoccaceae bacterium]
MSFESANSQRLLAELFDFGHVPNKLPNKFIVDRRRRRVTKAWREEIQSLTTEPFKLLWDEARFLLERSQGGVIRASFADLEPAALPAALESLSFSVGVAASLFGGWYNDDVDYVPPWAGPGHYDLGWLCAFKGQGYLRLTSRRWLDFGPWKLIRGAEDLSVLQFHALDASLAEALAQARPAHARLADPETGGMVHEDRDVQHDIRGTYDAKERLLKVPVLGRAISTAEMMDFRWAERFGHIPTPGPLERIAFVFLDEAEVGTHLHELWVRGFECWTIRDGLEYRLDDAYQPVPEPPPPWART